MKWLILAIAAILALRALSGDGAPARQPVNRAAEIKAGCEREFAGDPDSVARCRGILISRELDSIRAAKLEAAAR